VFEKALKNVPMGRPGGAQNGAISKPWACLGANMAPKKPKAHFFLVFLITFNLLCEVFYLFFVYF
jgi:hypothetical protein